uniref:Uncharacterized protein n=1 Tax=Corethron hystrix TaxID=216773 RepID=A0A7S1FZQ0_9STRA|mmetsp:Transcript_41841/g.98037  ORF Transcript_41841/g.98037 Transcript_41841/m.98037 type:complete len:1247 (+) Transcript_41841:2620-6360(+)
MESMNVNVSSQVSNNVDVVPPIIEQHLINTSLLKNTGGNMDHSSHTHKSSNNISEGEGDAVGEIMSKSSNQSYPHQNMICNLSSTEEMKKHQHMMKQIMMNHRNQNQLINLSESRTSLERMPPPMNRTHNQEAMNLSHDHQNQEGNSNTHSVTNSVPGALNLTHGHQNQEGNGNTSSVSNSRHASTNGIHDHQNHKGNDNACSVTNPCSVTNAIQAAMNLANDYQDPEGHGSTCRLTNSTNANNNAVGINQRHTAMNLANNHQNHEDNGNICRVTNPTNANNNSIGINQRHNSHNQALQPSNKQTNIRDENEIICDRSSMNNYQKQQNQTMPQTGSFNGNMVNNCNNHQNKNQTVQLSNNNKGTDGNDELALNQRLVTQISMVEDMIKAQNLMIAERNKQEIFQASNRPKIDDGNDNSFGGCNVSNDNKNQYGDNLMIHKSKMEEKKHGNNMAVNGTNQNLIMQMSGNRINMEDGKENNFAEVNSNNFNTHLCHSISHNDNKSISSSNQSTSHNNQSILGSNQYISLSNQTISNPNRPISHSNQSVSHNNQSVPQSTESVCYGNQSHPDSNQAISHSNQSISHSNQSISHSNQSVSHLRVENRRILSQANNLGSQNQVNQVNNLQNQNQLNQTNSVLFHNQIKFGLRGHSQLDQTNMIEESQKCHNSNETMRIGQRGVFPDENQNYRNPSQTQEMSNKNQNMTSGNENIYKKDNMIANQIHCHHASRNLASNRTSIQDGSENIAVDRNTLSNIHEYQQLEQSPNLSIPGGSKNSTLNQGCNWHQNQIVQLSDRNTMINIQNHHQQKQSHIGSIPEGSKNSMSNLSNQHQNQILQSSDRNTMTNIHNHQLQKQSSSGCIPEDSKNNMVNQVSNQHQNQIMQLSKSSNSADGNQAVHVGLNSMTQNQVQKQNISNFQQNECDKIKVSSLVNQINQNQNPLMQVPSMLNRERNESSCSSSHSEGHNHTLQGQPGSNMSNVKKTNNVNHMKNQNQNPSMQSLGRMNREGNGNNHPGGYSGIQQSQSVSNTSNMEETNNDNNMLRNGSQFNSTKMSTYQNSDRFIVGRNQEIALMQEYVDKVNTEKLGSPLPSCWAKGHHFHRLSSSCGHTPIIHNPPNGLAHIDFVVNGKVECYEDVGAFNIKTDSGSDKAKTTVWQSRYTCDELGCAPDKKKDHEICKKTKCSHAAVPPVGVGDPKEFDLDACDFNGDEWNINIFNDAKDTKDTDEVLMNLINSTSNNVSEETANSSNA